MRLTTFQPPELRDENNNIVQNGTYGKYTSFTNPQNSGAFDYINNNLQALNNKQNEIEDSKANVGDSYTKAEADTLLDTKANKSITYTKTEVDSIANGKVSKSGNTMSGNLAFSQANAVINKTTDDGYTVVYGGGGWSAGGGVAIYGKNNSEAGKALLHAADGTSEASIYVMPNGTTSAPTPATTDNSTKIATTAYVNNRIANMGTTFEYTGTVSTVTGSGNTVLKTVALEAGTYIAVGKIKFNVSSAGRVFLGISSFRDASSAQFGTASISALANQNMAILTSNLMTITAKTDIHLTSCFDVATTNVNYILRFIRVR